MLLGGSGLAASAGATGFQAKVSEGRLLLGLGEPWQLQPARHSEWAEGTRADLTCMRVGGSAGPTC